MTGGTVINKQLKFKMNIMRLYQCKSKNSYVLNIFNKIIF